MAPKFWIYCWTSKDDEDDDDVDDDNDNDDDDDHRNTACFWIADGGGFWGEARVDEDPMGGEGRPGGQRIETRKDLEF